MRIANDLADRQNADGSFAQSDFYAKAFAVNLWTRLASEEFQPNIARALNALRSDPQGKSYHREFIEYALRDTSGITDAQIRDILRDAPNQHPDVANWQILALINHMNRTKGGLSKLLNTAHWAFIRLRYWRTPAFLDRPICFSSQYHAFCAALLAESSHRGHQRISQKATRFLARLIGSHGFANLLGRGAGQSFGAGSAVYALTHYGFIDQASAVLSRIEDAVRQAGELPLNLLAPNALPDAPGPKNPKTPGWYSYSRHDDYLAFAGVWLAKTTKLKLPKTSTGRSDVCDSRLITQFPSPHYHAQMALSGQQSFDISGAPVVLTGSGKKARLLMPPTGGEVDQESLYPAADIPLPAIAEQQFSRISSSKKLGDRKVQITFELNGNKGHRTIAFHDHQITIRDQWLDVNNAKADLFRIVIDHRVNVQRISASIAACPDIGIVISSDTPIEITTNAAFSAAGPATRITARSQTSATLTIRSED
jgi:hypothetical protein